MKPWSQRPIEHRTLLNPAFLALLVTEAARGYVDERAAPLPFAFAFLAVPLVVHEPTRESMPTISTSMFAWLQRHPQARVYIPPLAVQFVAPVREAAVGCSSRRDRLHSPWRPRAPTANQTRSRCADRRRSSLP